MLSSVTFLLSASWRLRPAICHILSVVNCLLVTVGCLFTSATWFHRLLASDYCLFTSDTWFPRLLVTVGCLSTSPTWFHRLLASDYCLLSAACYAFSIAWHLLSSVFFCLPYIVFCPESTVYRLSICLLPVCLLSAMLCPAHRWPHSGAPGM